MRLLDDTDSRLVIELASEADTERLGVALADVLPVGSVVGLVGPLGAGKTRLVCAIAVALGVHPDDVSSPTFVLIHEYAGRVPVYHFDAYRLESPREFEALGAAEYFAGQGVCLVEWADRVEAALPATAWRIAIDYDLVTPSGRLATLVAPHDCLTMVAHRLAGSIGP